MVGIHHLTPVPPPDEQALYEATSRRREGRLLLWFAGDRRALVECIGIRILIVLFRRPAADMLVVMDARIMQACMSDSRTQWSRGADACDMRRGRLMLDSTGYR